MTRKYPLEPVQRLRAEQVDDRARVLGDALRAVEEAGKAAQRRAEAQEAHAQACAAVLGGEQHRLERGELRIGDLADRDAWATAAAAEQAERQRMRDVAGQALATARQQAEARRGQLQLAQAEAKVVDQHAQAFRAGEQRAALARDEEDAEEAHLASRTRGPAS